VRGSPAGRRPSTRKGLPLRPRRQLLVVLVLLGVALGGVEHQPAVAAPRETPARKITRLRAKAAHVQAAIDRMHGPGRGPGRGLQRGPRGPGPEQAERQERLRSRLVAKRRQIESRLAAHRRYLKRLTRQVRKAVVQEGRRQERLRRQALLRRMAAERASRARAAGSWRAGIGGAGLPPGPPGGRSRSPGASSASRTCGGRPGRAATTAPA
jgi:hypothetical protein